MKLPNASKAERELLVIGLASIGLSVLLIVFTLAVIVPVDIEQKRRIGSGSFILRAAAVNLLATSAFLIVSAVVVLRNRKHLDASQGASADTDRAPCAECNEILDLTRMISLNGVYVCSRCKPAHLQKLREGIQTDEPRDFPRTPTE